MNNQVDIVKIAKDQIKIFDRPSATTSLALIEEVLRLRDIILKSNYQVTPELLDEIGKFDKPFSNEGE